MPSLDALFPYQDKVWVDAARERGFRGPAGLALTYPPALATTARPEWRPADGRIPASDLGQLRRDILDPWRVEKAIVNCYYAIDSLRHPDWAIAMARSVNDWLIDQWLEKDPRLAASLVIPARDPAAAAAEIDRVGGHPGFVQVLLPVRSERLYGQRVFWPLFEAIERNDLVAGLHWGGLAEHGPTPTGYASWYVEEYAEEPQVFGAQLTSMIVEGCSRSSRPAGVGARGRVHLAADLGLEPEQEVEGSAPRVPVGGPAAVGDHPRPFPLLDRARRHGSAGADAAASSAGSCTDDLLMYASDYPHLHTDDLSACWA